MLARFLVDIFSFIKSLLQNGDAIKIISSIIGILTGNSPQQTDDLPDPEIDKMFEEIIGQNKNSPMEIIGEGYGLNPISKIADKQIIYCLTRHLGQG